jgi:8-oxo-dGTP diphosphatase
MSKEITSRGIIILEDEVILLFRRKNNKEYYAIPGGHIEGNETKEECLMREIKEELNIDVEVLNLLGVLEKEEKVEYVYNCKYLGGKLKLGGEELEHNNSNNYYEIRKVNINNLDNINLYPENLAFIKKALKERK